MTTIDDRARAAQKLIDSLPCYKIPRIQALKKTDQRTGKTMSACQICGNPFFHVKNVYPDKCKPCRKNILDLKQN